MIILRNVTIGNFLSIETATLTLDDQGLVLIEGVNEDDPSAVSNGSGKSSIVDAISWCLYGQTARGTSGDSVVNIKAGKDCFVEISLDIDGAPYVIMRGRKHKTLRNAVRVRQGPTDLTLGTDKMTQERINGLLGCSVHTFNAAIYMGQENMADLPSMTDKGLKAVLEEALSLDKLDMALSLVNQEIATWDTDYKAKTVKLGMTDERIEAAETFVTTLRLLAGECTKDIVALKDDLKEKFNYFAGECDAADKDLRDATLRLNAALKVTRTDPMGLLKERMTKEVNPLKEKVTRLYDKLSELKADRMDVDTRLTALKDKSGECHACGRPHDVGVDHTDRIKDLEVERQNLVDAYKKVTSQTVVLAEKISDLERVINKEYSDAKLAYADIEYLHRDIRAAAERKDALTARQRDQHNRTTEAIKSKQERMLDCQKNIEHHLKTIEDQESLALQLRDQITAMDEEMEVLGKVKHALGRKGFRGEILDQVTPYLNTRTQHYLEGLTDGNIEAVWATITQNADGDFVENFHIEVKHQSGVDKFALLSGGEKRKVRLACALALQDLVATRAVKPIKLFIADEIDDAIDEAGLELLMGILEQKAREVGSVFVISHNDLGDWCRNKITVTKRDGVSTFKAP